MVDGASNSTFDRDFSGDTGAFVPKTIFELLVFLSLFTKDFLICGNFESGLFRICGCESGGLGVWPGI